MASAAALAGSGGLVRAIELPAKAQALREQGVPGPEVAAAVRASKDHGLTAAETADVLDAARGAKIDNLGAFVKAKLDEGLRGRELADAIHEEQGRRGKGPDGEKGGKGPDGAPGEGKEGKGQGDDGGKEGKGKSGKGGH